jgi:hypothetical protein
VGINSKAFSGLCRFVVLFDVVVIATWFGCVTVQGEIVVKSRSNNASTISPAQAGDITTTIKLPFDKIASLANHAALAFNSTGTFGSVFSYRGTLTLAQISVGRSDKDVFPLRISAPFRLKGVFAGYDIDQEGAASVNVAIAFGPNWCPAVTFDDPSVTLATKERLPVTITKSIPSFGDFVAAKFLGSELRTYVTCDAVKSAIAKQWVTISFPIQAGGKPLYVTLEPRSVALSPITVTDSHVALTVRLVGVMGVKEKSAKSEVKTLPQVQSIPPAATKESASDIEASLGAPINLNFK